MSIASTALPAVSYCSKQSDYNRLVDSGNLRFSYRRDADVRAERWAVRWNDVEPEVVSAVLTHYEQHGAATFKWKAPSDASSSTWRYVTAPTVQYLTARSASIAVELDRVLAFIT